MRPKREGKDEAHGTDAHRYAARAEGGAQPAPKHAAYSHAQGFKAAQPAKRGEALGRLLAFRLVRLLHHDAVAQPDDPIGLGGYLWIVSHHDHRRAKRMNFVEQFHHTVAGLVVEVPGGLIGEQQPWAVGERPGDRHPLLLTA